jgi:hypothetical protein
MAVAISSGPGGSRKSRVGLTLAPSRMIMIGRRYAVDHRAPEQRLDRVDVDDVQP